ncbi:NAD(P)-binding protein [Solirubrobacter deserti]|uniref:NAD(P)-binding protein n=1 Tax=Solirubrobacter deserti TaxID=2282478 RepID=A0ABT4RJS5_9ACTN|nr:NAD(P)-binding protein [Solirubrobacter deserti]MDA0138767.1 NAD(P)-binding protein [Solirubrobacter deserti]
MAVIGAGFGGIAAALALKPRHDVLMIDRAHDVGGTWLLNDYPGAACDVPSHLCSFSFEQRRDWPRLCSPRDEIIAYIRRLAAKHRLEPTLRSREVAELFIFQRTRTDPVVVDGDAVNGYAVDCIIYATGFKATDFVLPLRITARGRALQDA